MKRAYKGVQKEYPTMVLLSVATNLAMPNVPFSDLHGCITHVLGWDVFTHELADKAVWDQAAENIALALPTLWAEAVEIKGWTKANKGALDFQDVFAAVADDAVSRLGPTAWIAKGAGERAEHPLASLQRIAPDKPVVVVEVPGGRDN